MFRKKFTLEKRIAESKKLLLRHPSKVPVIIETELKLDRKKYLVSNDMKLSNFVYYLRIRMKIQKYNAIFCLSGNSIPQQSMLLSQIYKEHVGEDGFLVLELRKENTFGERQRC